MRRHPSHRHSPSAMLALLLLVTLTACGSSETHWNDDALDGGGDTSGGDVGSDTTSPSDTSVSDTSEPDTTVEDTSHGDAADTSGDTSGDTTDIVVPVPSLRADDQVLERIDEVVVAEAAIEGPTWVVVRDPQLGSGADAVLGQTLLDGSERVVADVRVALARDLLDNEQLVAALYVDAGEAGVFEPEGADVVLTDDIGQAVEDTFVVSVPTAMLAASDQTVELSTVLLVAQAITGERGWLIVHPDAGDGTVDATTVLAAVASPGTLTDGSEPLAVVLDAPLSDGAHVLHVVLYGEDGDPDVFEPGVDAPLATDTVTEAAITVTVDAGTPAVRLSVTAADTAQGYRWAAEPDAFAVLATDTGNDALALRGGWRYEIATAFTASHPLELIESTSGLALLSQDGDGSLEGDPSVTWEESADALRFTVSATLAAAVDGYRCALHPDAMFGAVTVSSDP